MTKNDQYAVMHLPSRAWPLRSGFRHRDPFQKFATHCWTWKWHGGFLKRRLSNAQVYKCCW